MLPQSSTGIFQSACRTGASGAGGQGAASRLWIGMADLASTKARTQSGREVEVKPQPSGRRWNRTMPYRTLHHPGLDEMMRRFGAELRRCRYHAGLSQTQLAERSGVAQSTISRMERGIVPRAAMYRVVLLAAALEKELPARLLPTPAHLRVGAPRRSGASDREPHRARPTTLAAVR